MKRKLLRREKLVECEFRAPVLLVMVPGTQQIGKSERVGGTQNKGCDINTMETKTKWSCSRGSGGGCILHKLKKWGECMPE